MGVSLLLLSLFAWLLGFCSGFWFGEFWCFECCGRFRLVPLTFAVVSVGCLVACGGRWLVD